MKIFCTIFIVMFVLFVYGFLEKNANGPKMAEWLWTLLAFLMLIAWPLSAILWLWGVTP
jgi:hypothetical protein